MPPLFSRKGTNMSEKTKLAAQIPKNLIIGVFIFCIFVALVSLKAIDNDTWWLLALGRSVINDGIPTTDPLSMHTEMQYVSQQWMSATIFYNIHNLFSPVGLYIFCRLANVTLIVLVYMYLKVHSASNMLSLIGTAIICVPLLSMFGVLRPQIFTYILLITEGILLEKYVQSGKYRYLYALPLISILQINLHASMWFMQFIIVLPYIGEYVYATVKQKITNKPCENKCQYKLTPIIITTAVSAVCGLANPYGVKAITYIFGSFGVEEINQTVHEMAPLSFGNSQGGVIFVVLALCLFCKLYNRQPARYALFVFGFAVLSFAVIKSFAYFLLFAVPAVIVTAQESGDYFENNDIHFSRKHKSALCIVCVVLLSLVPLKDVVSEEGKGIDGYEKYGLSAVIDYAENNTDINPASKIYADYNTGGYLEYRGYKPFIDARAEVFIPANNHSNNYFEEYLSAKKSTVVAAAFLEKYEFDYIITEDSSAISQFLTMQDENSTGGYKLICYGESNAGSFCELWGKTENDRQ